LKWREHTYAVPVRREVDPARLATIDPAALETADESGFLAGNAMFQDLSGLSWADAATAVAAETELITRLKAAEDLDAEAELVDEERYDAFENADALWNLDVGVIGAVIVLSALGCAPVGSCNAGGFGGQHQGQHPYVTFYLPSAAMGEVLALAAAAQVGLILDEDGRAQLYSDHDLGLIRFAELAVSSQIGGAPYQR
jgi:hypothetical protein